MTAHARQHSGRFTISNILGKLQRRRTADIHPDAELSPKFDDKLDSDATWEEQLSSFVKGLPAEEVRSLQCSLTTYTVHGLILAPLPKRPTAILDAGSGSCQWAHEVVQSYPEAYVCAVDKMDAHIPALSPLRPKPMTGVDFIIQDLTKIFRPEWSEKFDVVNVRHVFYELLEKSWDIVLANLYTVMQPGGWIQIVEYGNYSSETQALGQLSRLNKHVMRLDGFAPEQISRIHERLKNSGFHSITHEVETMLLGRSNPVTRFSQFSVETMLADLTRAQKSNHSKLTGKSVKIDGITEVFPHTDDEYQQLLLAALKQLQNGSRDVHVFIAQKSSATEVRRS
ncbi:hypothetical protein BD410DRAFT_28434 [Rickenella mellea]|uniref:Methyltransferase domain-containing protein n=1 Tax=Rickenella mellea TaxID=50990 RepID=A0A4R5XES3_9AGAM|nr:hypothetical protein BD410DRAFT_28434 [Rickenella mellea]